MKNILIKKILYFILLLIFAFVSIFLLALDSIPKAVSILILVLVLAYSVIGFIYVTKHDKRVIIEEEREEESQEEKQIKKYEFNNKRCPKCGKPYDGETCFYCGFERMKK